MSTRRELTPEEEAWRQKKFAWRQWERTTCTGLSPERLEEDLRRVDAEAKATEGQATPIGVRNRGRAEATREGRQAVISILRYRQASIHTHVVMLACSACAALLACSM